MSANQVVVTSLEAMHELGNKLGSKLLAGDLILLSGPLGAGKTALTQGIGLSFGISEITSPTFVISKIHNGRIRLVHVDAYRLQGQSAAIFDDLDLESYLETSITVVEWGEGLADRFSKEYLEINIAFGSGENDRVVSTTPHGARWLGFDL
ncbi:MAG: tRNA (adenosine(37)-N6)-threonylcarbamoyltransferase complex ATPase subunit type 1 TsaE [Actinobacteria bacterium]|nr:tRNA (adenosine(37)-N6)-threonylcarbamoyltransferase complex ATPase subunit type 1 TsaE [Actinomycetota bacterium]